MLSVHVSVFFGLFSSLALSAAIPVGTNNFDSAPSGNTTAITSCADPCVSIVTNAGCAANVTACFCSMDFKPTTQFYKCLYNECPIDGAGAQLLFIAAACDDLEFGNSTSATLSGSATSAFSATPTASESAFPTIAPATEFTLPTCGSACINATNVPVCANSLSDPACVCSSGSKGDSEGVNNIFKCFFETCDEAGAANSFNAFQMNCGQLPPQVPVSQWPYPAKNFAAANTTASDGTSQSSGSASGTASATASGTSAAASPSHSSAAGLLESPSLLMFATALMGAVLL